MFNQIYGTNDTKYSMFLFNETNIYDELYSSLNTTKHYAFVVKGDLSDLMDDLGISRFSKNELYKSNKDKLKLKLIQNHFPDSFIRQPKSRTLDGEFYTLTKNEFDLIPFKSEPITSARESIFSVTLNDSVKVDSDLLQYIHEHLSFVKTNEEKNYLLKYRPMIKVGVERYVPHTINLKAFDLAKKHNLSFIEFNFLNYFYETGKSLRNGCGQMYYDIKHKGLGWTNDRKWVEKTMEKLIFKLELVELEKKYDCRDRKYTSWYFYDANKNLDDLKHDF